MNRFLFSVLVLEKTKAMTYINASTGTMLPPCGECFSQHVLKSTFKHIFIWTAKQDYDFYFSKE